MGLKQMELGTSDLLVHRIHAFTIHVTVLIILLKGVLFARNSRLITDKALLRLRVLVARSRVEFLTSISLPSLRGTQPLGSNLARPLEGLASEAISERFGSQVIAGAFMRHSVFTGGGACQVSAWDHVFLGLFWMYNSISIVIFHFRWKMQSDV